VENQAYLVAANAVGPSGPFHYAGGSVVLSPAGERLAALGEEEGIAMGTIDPAAVEETRRRIPCRNDRNPRAYRKTRPPG
jgi:predicted amidohydrolase